MGVMFDIIGSILVRTAIVLIILRMNVSLNTMATEAIAHSTIQQELAILRSVMSTDFDYAGYNVPVGTAFVDAKEDKITFKGDLNNDGTAETIAYYYGSKTELSNTPNPEDRKLYRQIGSGTPLNVANGITKCVFTYYNNSGVATTTKSEIKSFSISVTMQDGAPIDNRYPSTYWEQSFFPPNL